MPFNFEFSTKKIQATSNYEPQIIIKNNKGRKDLKTDNSYLHLNKAAVELLERERPMPLVSVGIDTATKKICIVPAEDGVGRKLTKSESGSAAIYIDALITTNNIPTQVVTPRFYDNFAPGGLLFDYKTVE